MKYFESIADSYFKKTNKGKDVFYLWGVLGKGYIIPTEEKAIEIRKSFKKCGIISLLFVYFTLYMGKSFGIPVAAGFLIFYTFAYYIYVQTITRQMEKTSERLTLMDSYLNMSRSLSWFNLILFTTGCLMFVLAGA